MPPRASPGWSRIFDPPIIFHALEKIPSHLYLPALSFLFDESFIAHRMHRLSIRRVGPNYGSYLQNLDVKEQNPSSKNPDILLILQAQSQPELKP